MLRYSDDGRYILQFSKTTFKTTRLGPYKIGMLPEIKNADGTERSILSIPQTTYEQVYYQYPNLRNEFIRFTDPKYSNLTLKDVKQNCHLKAEWVCKTCNHKREANVLSRTNRGDSCKFCCKFKISFPEKYIYNCLSQVDTVLQENYKIQGMDNMEFDMYDPELKLAIEFSQGRYHQGRQDADEKKLKYALDNNIRLIRVWQIHSERQISRINNNEYIIPHKNSINGVPDLNIIIDDICEQYNLDQSLIDRKQAQDQAFLRTNKNPPAGQQLIDVNADMCRDWDYNKNGVIKPDMLYSSSGIEIHWKCLYCHKEQIAQPNHKTARNKNIKAGCKKCHLKIAKGYLQEIPYIPDK